MAPSVRVRFAPSPTGYLHVGGARTALFNWLYARHHGGTFVLRIEDTDEARNTEPAMRAIFDALRWLGLDWDEGPGAREDHGPYYQSRRRSIYDAYLEKLRASGRTYEDNGAIRFRFSREPVTIPDMVCGDTHFAAIEEPDMTIRRPDGSYIFHFVNVVDDIEMKITHVIRGEDHLSNTWKHVDLFRALDKTPPGYGHIPLLLNPNGSKMSKRDEGASMSSYIESGFLPQAVFNYLCLLGWTPALEGEVFSKEEASKVFEISQVHHSNARFDMAKCTWLNQQHLRHLDGRALVDHVRPWLEKEGLDIRDADYAARVLESVKEKVSLASEFPGWTHYFFRDDFSIDSEAMAKLSSNPQASQMLAALEDALKNASGWDEAALTQSIHQAAEQQKVKPGALMPLLRASVSGQMRGPDVKVMMGILGRERVLKRISQAAATIVRP